MQVESIDAVRGQSFDFLIAHHVLEHIPSTLETLVQWMELVVDEGRMFLSVPNHTTTPDSRRLVTPPTHFLLDYIYQIGPDDFESREHIGSFLWSWIDVGGLEGRSKVEAADLVSSAMMAPTNDLHWHVFNAHTLEFVVSMAARIAGRRIAFELVEDGALDGGEHRVVVRLGPPASGTDAARSDLAQLRELLRPVVYSLAISTMEGKQTYALSRDRHAMRYACRGGMFHPLGSAVPLAPGEDLNYTYFEIGDQDIKYVAR